MIRPRERPAARAQLATRERGSGAGHAHVDAACCGCFGAAWVARVCLPLGGRVHLGLGPMVLSIGADAGALSWKPRMRERGRELDSCIGVAWESCVAANLHANAHWGKGGQRARLGCGRWCSPE